MAEDISSPHWYTVARRKGEEPHHWRVVAGPFHNHAEAILAREESVQRNGDVLEFTIADIRFPTFEGLLQRPAAKTEIEELREELVRLRADMESHCTSTRHPWL